MISMSNFRRTVAALVLSGLFVTVGTAVAQAPVPPPPPPPGAGQPVPPVPPGGAGASVDPAKAQEVNTYLDNGKNAIGQLDLTSAQMYFEQAFAKCDQYSIKGPLQAKVYMALGALFAGYLQQVPQGTQFMKMALSLDPTVRPEPSMINDAVNGTFATVATSMGILAAPAAGPGVGAPVGLPTAAGQFWIMKHERVTSAKRMYPLGLWVDTNPMVAIQSVRLYFRLPSDSNYQGANMQQNGTMFGMVINCDAIALLDPENIFYYIEVIGGDGTVVASEGSAENPVQLSMFKEDAFRGEQPFLPGMEPLPVCNPDEAAPCPPWDPHCHDMPCVTTEDCLGGRCYEGFCVQSEGSDEDEPREYIGLSLALTVGTGFGIVVGTEPGLTPEADPIDLVLGLSSSTLFSRFRLGYFIMDSLLVGAMMRYQIPVFAGGAKDDGDYRVGGLLFGIDAAWFLYGGDQFGMGKGQVVEEDGTLAEKPGLRWYARVAYDFYGAIYHSVVVKGPDATGKDSREDRVHASGMSGVGVGSGILYGFNRHVDLNAELMYDYMFPKATSAHNFDVHVGINVHF